MQRRALLQATLLAAFIAPLAGCGGDPGAGPVEVKWDRDACERCRMVLSDRRHAAQVRFTDPGGRSRVMKFDDLGCAIIWLEDKPWKEAASTEVWVNDHRDGRWIDARTAYFLGGQLTPMEYGLGAQDTPLEGAMRYTDARTHVLAIEERFNRHGADVRADARAREPGTTAPPSHNH